MRKVHFLLISFGIYLCGGSPITSSSNQPSAFTIEKTWDGIPVDEDEKVQFTLQAVPDSQDIAWSIDAPFYDDPPPGGTPGQPFLGLWDYEVVEVFFLNDKDQYLEVEVSPHGQHIVLLLNGERNTIRHSLPLIVETEIKGQRWRANATIPGHYIPPQVTKLNAYAIHGVGEERKYLSLYPTDGTTSAPDFHNLSFFKFFNIVAVNPLHKNYTELSPLWKDSLEGIFKYKITRQWNNFRSKIPATKATLQGFEGGVEVNFSMPLNDESYPAESFVVIFENEKNEAVKFQFFVDGNYFVEFFNNRKNKLEQNEKLTLDYRVNNRHSRFVKGSALVPPSFFPPKVTLMNMYSLFGVETMLAMTLRGIEIKSGADFRPNLSNIEHFTPIDFDLLVASNDEYSPLWRKLLNLSPSKIEEKSLVKVNEDVAEEPKKEATTIAVDEESVPEVTSTPDTVPPAVEVEEVSEGIITEEETTENPTFTEGETLGVKYDDTFGPQDSIESKVKESDITPLSKKPMRFLLKGSPVSQSSVKRETSSTKDKKNDENKGRESQPTEENVVEESTEEPMETSAGNENDLLIDPSTENSSIMAEESEVEVETEESPIQEIVSEKPSMIVEDKLVTRSIEEISQDNENTTASEIDSEVTSMPEIAEPTTEGDSGNDDSITVAPEESIAEDTTPPKVYTTLIEEETLLKTTSEDGSEKTDNEKDKNNEPPLKTPSGDNEIDKILGQREEHPRRYEENSDKNEIPITFKITFDSPGKIKDEIDSLEPPKLSPDDTLAEDYSFLDEISEDLPELDEILPPPHPICFTEGLVPDFYRCQVFYECVLENGRWEVYNWRCKRGSYYDPAKVACIRGYC